MSEDARADMNGGHRLHKRTMNAVTAGRWREALRLADQLCRAHPHDVASHLTIMALAAMRCGDIALSAECVTRALAVSPTFLPAARIGLGVLSGEPLRRCAIIVFTDDRDDSLVGRAAALALRDGEPLLSIRNASGQVTLRVAQPWQDTLVDVVAGWSPQCAMSTPITRRDTVIDAIGLTQFQMPRPAGPAVLSVGLRSASGALREARFSVATDPGDAFPHELPIASEVPLTRLNVIVPIYADAAATRECLESLDRQSSDHHARRVILVDDASPDPDMAGVLNSYCGASNWKLIRNETNLGFTGAVNRGLAHCLPGDVVLLNADTVLPAGCLDRLTLTAAANPDAGTLTPLSNNGQYMSFPQPFTSNPMPGAVEANSLAQAAWAANGQGVIDVPSGIGFCLYVRGACMSRLSSLSEQFDKGYYEDVDLCLRAERAGWRNVCATGVYVAHHGSRSFRDTKAYLAARNRGILDKLYPAYAKRSAAWLSEDPLRPARARIERNLPASERASAVLLASDDASTGRAQDYATELARTSDVRPLLALLETRNGRRVLRLRAADGAAPQNLDIAIGSTGFGDLEAALLHNCVGKVIVFDPAAIDEKLLYRLRDLTLIELRDGDAGIFCPRRSLVGAGDRYCNVPTDPRICAECLGATGLRSRFEDASAVSAWRAAWSSLVFDSAGAPRASYIARFADLSRAGSISPKGAGRASAHAPDPKAPPRLAIIPLAACASDTKLVGALANGRLAQSGGKLLIFGNLLDGRRYQDREDIVHLAHIEPDEIEPALHLHGATHVLLASRRFVVADPIVNRALSWAFPVARFSFPFQETSWGTRDRLLLEVEDSNDVVAERLNQWVHASSTVQASSAESGTS